MTFNNGSTSESTRSTRDTLIFRSGPLTVGPRVIIGLPDRRFAAEAVPSRSEQDPNTGPTDLDPMKRSVMLSAFSGSAEGSDCERTSKPAARNPWRDRRWAGALGQYPDVAVATMRQFPVPGVIMMARNQAAVQMLRPLKNEMTDWWSWRITDSVVDDGTLVGRPRCYAPGRLG